MSKITPSELRSALRGLMKLAWRDLPAFVEADHPQAELAQMMRKTSLWLEGFEPNPWEIKREYTLILGDGSSKVLMGDEIVASDCSSGFRPATEGETMIAGVKYRRPAQP